MRGPFVVTPGLEESPVPRSRPPGTGRSDRLSSTLLPNPGIEESRRAGEEARAWNLANVLVFRQRER